MAGAKMYKQELYYRDNAEDHDNDLKNISVPNFPIPQFPNPISIRSKKPMHERYKQQDSNLLTTLRFGNHHHPPELSGSIRELFVRVLPWST
jgi:hypothetical protein